MVTDPKASPDNRRQYISICCRAINVPDFCKGEFFVIHLEWDYATHLLAQVDETNKLEDIDQLYRIVYYCRPPDLLAALPDEVPPYLAEAIDNGGWYELPSDLLVPEEELVSTATETVGIGRTDILWWLHPNDADCELESDILPVEQLRGILSRLLHPYDVEA